MKPRLRRILLLILILLLISILCYQYMKLSKLQTKYNLNKDSWYIPGKNVCIVMVCTPNLDNLYKNAILINENFSVLNNYGFFIIRKHNNKNRHVAWERIPAIIKMFEMKYKYVLYIDADAFITNNYIKKYKNLDYFINLSNKTNKIIMFEDKFNDKTLGCSGVLFFKNNQKTLNFINKWNNSSYKYKQLRFNHPWEQGALWKIRKNNQNMFINLPIIFGGCWSSQYIKHYRIGTFIGKTHFKQLSFLLINKEFNNQKYIMKTNKHLRKTIKDN